VIRKSFSIFALLKRKGIITGKQRNNEKDISTFGQEKKEQAWFQKTQCDQKRPAGIGSTQGQRKEKIICFLRKNT